MCLSVLSLRADWMHESRGSNSGMGMKLRVFKYRHPLSRKVCYSVISDAVQFGT